MIPESNVVLKSYSKMVLIWLMHIIIIVVVKWRQGVCLKH